MDTLAKLDEDTTTGTGWKTYTPYKPCHTGNFNLYTAESGHFLQIGGWSKNAVFYKDDVVIDLTGKENPDDVVAKINKPLFKRFLTGFGNPVFGWLSLPLVDYGVPALKKLDWINLTSDIKKALIGHDVVICCQMGHGRTGMAASIIGHMIYKNVDGWDSPVKKLRAIYCKEAVDTLKQEEYVYKILGLDIKPDLEAYKTYTPTKKSPVNSGTDSALTVIGEWCPICKKVRSDRVVKYGLCHSCQDKLKKEIKDISKTSGLNEYEVVLVDDKGLCQCGMENCVGIFEAACNHVVHDQKDSFGTECDECYSKRRKSLGTAGG